MDYNNSENAGNGICAAAWGPACWFFLQCVAANYKQNPTRKDKTNAIEFLRALQTQLPCGACRSNFRKNWKEVVAKSFGGDFMGPFMSRDTFFEFIHELHASVRFQQQKGKLPFTLEQARHTIESLRAGECKKEGCKNKKRPCALQLRVVRGNPAKTFAIDRACLLK
jgi:hypothetical protein